MLLLNQLTPWPWWLAGTWSACWINACPIRFAASRAAVSTRAST